MFLPFLIGFTALFTIISERILVHEPLGQTQEISQPTQIKSEVKAPVSRKVKQHKEPSKCKCL